MKSIPVTFNVEVEFKSGKKTINFCAQFKHNVLWSLDLDGNDLTPEQDKIVQLKIESGQLNKFAEDAMELENCCCF